ncbi:hypothetical protein KI387_034735, partial [Taxus chinensis]
FQNLSCSKLKKWLAPLYGKDSALSANSILLAGIWSSFQRSWVVWVSWISPFKIWPSVLN